MTGSEPTEHRLAVTRTARYYTLGDAGPAVRDVWFVCHGYGQLAGSFARGFRAIASPHRLIVAPEALSRYYTDHAAKQVGATWMTREDRLAEIEDYVAYLDTLYEQVLARLDGATQLTVRVLGFSQGVHTVCRWVGLGTVVPDGLILWGSPGPMDLDYAAVARKLHAPPVLVVGDRDEYVTPKVIEAETARFAEAGLALAVRRFEGGHRLDDETLRALAGVGREP